MSNRTPESRALLTAFVSIHDVAPSTIDKTAQLLDCWRTARRRVGEDFKSELLVIPGLDWKDSQIEQLQQWAAEGHQLVGHGWIHKSGPRRNLWHWLHSLLLSRDVAEHLSKASDELEALVHRCYAWFGQHDLPSPKLYVPPAWATGRLTRKMLTALPFRFFEYLGGYFDSAIQKVYKMPLVGFEADTLSRSLALRAFNQWNFGKSLQRARPVRVSLHPFDLDFRLGQQIRELAASQRLQCELATEWLLDQPANSDLLP